MALKEVRTGQVHHYRLRWFRLESVCRPVAANNHVRVYLVDEIGLITGIECEISKSLNFTLHRSGKGSEVKILDESLERGTRN
jgi:hypothetical protein